MRRRDFNPPFLHFKMSPEVLREIQVKEEAETDPQYGCYPGERSIQQHIQRGIINLDKPAGPTSHQVVSWVKDILGIERGGHSGTLDPRVTGVLPVGLMDSTKILLFLLTAGKEYVTLMDVHGNVSDGDLGDVFTYMRGRILQRPPLKSAVKRQLRERTIYDLTILERDDRMVLFKVSCEAGTYIRKLCNDIGLIVGVGAHMLELRRTRAGPFTEEGLVTLHDLKDAYEFYRESGDESYLRKVILPVEEAVQNLGRVWVKDSAVDAVCHGANLNAPGVVKLEKGIDKNDTVAIFSLKNELVAIGRSLRSSEEISGMKKGEVINLARVVMKPGTYPRKWKTG